MRQLLSILTRFVLPKIYYLIVIFFMAGLLSSLSFNQIKSSFAWQSIAALNQIFNYSDRISFQFLPGNIEQNSQIKSYAAMNQIHKFPLGTYDRIDKPEHPFQIKQMGFDLVMPYTNPYAQGSYEKIRTYLDQANSVGLKVLLEPFREQVKQQKFAEVTNFVNIFKNHPAIFGWYAYDEPIYQKLSPQTLNTLYQTIRSADSNHPIMVDFSGSRGARISDYYNSFDIAMINRYPLTKHKDGRSKDGFLILRSFQRIIAQTANHVGDYPFWLVTQAFQDQTWRLPNFIEQKYMLYAGITGGAKGVFFYAFHRAPNQWKQATIKPLIAELKAYLPAFYRGELNNQVSVNKAKVTASLYPHSRTSKYLLVAINHSNKKRRAQISFNDNIFPSSLRLVDKKQPIYLNDNSFTSILKPYEVQIYLVD